MKGLDIRDTPMGFTAVRLHYSADPEKDPAADLGREWLTKQQALYPDPNTWAIEYEVNFDVGAGARVFPQFTHTTHVRELEPSKRSRIYRAWDFGWHCPVALFAQIDRKDRLLLLREVIGRQQTTREFAIEVVRRSAEWFPDHTPGFDDFCDPAGQQVQSVESERNERRDVEVLTGLGIFPQWEHGWSRKDGRALLHQLLALRSDMTPSLWLDDRHCPLTAQAFLGQYVYVTTQDGRIKEEPNDLAHPWADVMAAARYLAIGLHGRLGVARFHMGSVRPVVATTAHHGYGTPQRRTRGA